MRLHGVRVDLDQADKVKTQFSELENQMLAKVKKATGIDVEVWAADSVAQVFDKLGLTYSRTPKSEQPSFTKNFLANHPHEIAQAIVLAREYNKAHTTFVDTILKHQVNGRIHAELHPLRSDSGGTVTGRFSYSNPN